METLEQVLNLFKFMKNEWKSGRNICAVKNIFSPGNISQKVLIPQYDLQKRFATPTAKLKIAQLID